MDSQLATVLTSGGPGGQDGCRRAVAEEEEEGEGDASGAGEGNLQSRPAEATPSDADGGGAREPASQETRKCGGPGRPIRIMIVVPPRCQAANPAPGLTKDQDGSPVPASENGIRGPAAAAAGGEGGLEEAATGTADECAESLQRTEAGEAAGEERRESGVSLPCGEGADNWRCAGAPSQEQMEPLDLSLPRRRDRKCPRLLDDSGCESSLIMEVDEYDGDGDRDVVEEDDDGGDDSLLAPAPFDVLSPDDVDTENLLLIDDQGIPYTLSPDGVKVPQVDASSPPPPLLDQSDSAAASPSPPSSGANLNQSPDESLNATPEDPYPSPAPDPESQPGCTEAPPLAADVSVTAPDPSPPAPDPAAARPAPPPPTRPIQILAGPSANAPVLLLSSPSSSLPLGGAAPMLLLLSTSSPGNPASTSTPIAVLDPSTGQLSHIAAATAPVSLPLPSGQAASPLSRPIIRLSPGGAPVLLSGLGGARLPGPASKSVSTPGTEAISSQVSSESNKPSAATAAASPLAASLTYDPLSQPAAAAEPRSPPAKEPRVDSEHLPLEDHIYFSSSTAPPSPAVAAADLPSAKLEPLDPLDPLSPAASPGSAGARRVLYCQLCPRVFFYLSDLERHAITHSQKKPHVCQQCGKAFKRSSHLQRHKHIHTGQRNFVCPICAKRFREAGELQRHQRVHTGEKPYQCQLCHTRFAERNTLRRHTKRKHPYHQVAMEMLSERRDRIGGGGGGGGSGGSGVSAVHEDEESAEWYSSAVSHLDNSESDMET